MIAAVSMTGSLLYNLAQEVQGISSTVQGASTLGQAILSTPPAAGKWSVAQIVEHLNTYNRYYIPLIEASMGKAAPGNGTFRSGWLGAYFTRSMYSEVKSAQRVTNKMSAMKGHIPPATVDTAKILAEFLEAQQQLSRLIAGMNSIDPGTVKIPITISRFIRISIGDAVCFLVAHQVRHCLQIREALAALGHGTAGFQVSTQIP